MARGATYLARRPCIFFFCPYFLEAKQPVAHGTHTCRPFSPSHLANAGPTSVMVPENGQGTISFSVPARPRELEASHKSHLGERFALAVTNQLWQSRQVLISRAQGTWANHHQRMVAVVQCTARPEGSSPARREQAFSAEPCDLR